jgi:hypothetical protein
MVAAAVQRLPEPMRTALVDTPWIITDAPGAEVVADGVDPRIGVLLDATARETRSSDAPKVTRAFVYQRNVERTTEDPEDLIESLAYMIEDELCALFPALSEHATPLDHEDGISR